MSEKKPEAAPAPAADKAAPEAPAKGGGIKAFIPVILAVVLAPALTWGVAQFVLLPKLKAAVAAGASGAEAPAEHGAPAKAEKAEKAEKPAHGAKAEKGGHGEKGEKGAKESAESGYKFENVVVNLSGTMGTRYLKASFMVVGEKPDLVARFEAEKAKLGDITLAVLSSLTLADLEESGSKNILRERLVAAYNQALGERVADNLYFSDFVVQ